MQHNKTHAHIEHQKNITSGTNVTDPHPSNPDICDGPNAPHYVETYTPQIENSTADAFSVAHPVVADGVDANPLAIESPFVPKPAAIVPGRHVEVYPSWAL